MANFPSDSLSTSTIIDLPIGRTNFFDKSAYFFIFAKMKWQNSGDERDEDDEEHVTDDESDDDDDDIPYNPKNLPLGWDGKVGNQHASVGAVLNQCN